MQNERPVQTRIRRISPYLGQRSNTIANPRSKQMTKFNNTHKVTAGAAFGAAILFGMLSFGSSAEAAQSVFSCEGSTAKRVVSCCHEMTRNHLPFWMIRSGKNCNQITVVCHAKASTASTAAGLPIKRCYVKLENDDNPNGGGGNPGDGSDTKRDGGRGPNTSSSSSPN
jgi:hypothetical protein